MGGLLVETAVSEWIITTFYLLRLQAVANLPALIQYRGRVVVHDLLNVRLRPAFALLLYTQ